MTHFALAAAQRNELPATAGDTWSIQITASESWDATLATENTGSGTTGAELALRHVEGMGL
jgi:hypothetical protein